ncbi:homoserine dehydrogenase, partial [Natronoarchaeum mannanilyticum]
MKLAILGSGAVGSSVAELAGEYDHEVVALADSSSAVVDDGGVDVDAALDRKSAEG